MPSMNRILCCLIVGLCIAITLMGCNAVSKNERTNPNSGKIELEFWTLQMLNFADYINGMIKEYEAEHPNVKIKWVDVPFSEGEKKALTSMLSEQTPDIINLNPDFSAILASRGALLDMNKWVRSSQKQSFLPVAWDAATLGRQTFGIPWYLTSAVTLYNKDVLAAAGVKQPPQTYDAMMALAQSLKGKGKGYVLMPTLAESGRFFRVLQKQGVPIWQDGRLAFADNGAGKELAFWKRLFDQGLVPREAITESQQAAIDRYQSGTLALLLAGPNFLNIVKENAPAVYKSTDIAPQFPAQSDYMDFSEMLLVIPKRTEHPKEAVDFALFVTNPKNTLKLAELAPVLPPHSQALANPAFTQTKSTDLLAKGRSISAAQLLSATTVMQIHPKQNRLNQLMDFYVQSALLGKMSPEAAMKQAQQEMNALLQ